MTNRRTSDSVEKVPSRVIIGGWTIVDLKSFSQGRQSYIILGAFCEVTNQKISHSGLILSAYLKWHIAPVIYIPDTVPAGCIESITFSFLPRKRLVSR